MAEPVPQDAESAAGAGVIAFIGLGKMGMPMASCLIGGGHGVVGFDVSQAPRQKLAAAGGTAVATPAEAVTGARTVILMLPDSRTVEAVVDDIGDSLAAGTTVIDMSSSEPTSTRRLADLLAARDIRFIDAPVSGGVIRAVDGSLTIMVGAPEEEFERLLPVLSLMGTPQRAGEVGAGHAAKAINNLLSATHLLITAEGIEAGRRFGLDPALLIDIVNTSSGRSGSTETKYPKFVLPETFDSGFGLRLLVKDMRIAASLAREVGSSTELTDAAIEQWAAAAEELQADADHTEIARWMSARHG
ncbi:NAD(P)-dependent oxidoreductase [Streptomyces sp. HNM0575]|uniref:NAD(P)-dependent oxidoreductase n=1 Tax=Streptomyces sp. HNM0575 TaxID=2716338 RepID=UPI00145E93F9|nr:NAD(P)-dependent oxidoreductase [Streptomyces sp. HNM0575]NLU71876.1 NAD(P)-dependent oxidoreductase [Streptomyces sp. HNM0575]